MIYLPDSVKNGTQMNAENADKKNFFACFLKNPRSSAFVSVQKRKVRVVSP